VSKHGLRRAQLGATWSLSAHGTISKEPALIVLPTGVGKTLVLCLAPFLLRARRVLVVTPGKLVRAQVATAFETLKDLKDTGVLPSELTPPKVALAEHRATAADWSQWRKADVVVGTPNVLSDGYPEVTRIPEKLFDLIVFDEAHHLPAKVWTAILEATDAAAVLLTATPTRRDGKPLPGEIIYTYPLSQAIADEVYAPVHFVPVVCGQEEDPDAVLASAAAARLADPIHRQAGSKLLVRTGTQIEARRLVGVYAAVGLDLGLVLADTSPTSVRRILREVGDDTKQGFIAVGAMIEGFDFPALKVAAYHHPHRSLAPTLQFVGRLSRTGPEGIRGELLAIPEQVEGETRELYRQKRDWAELMPEIVDAAAQAERQVRRYVSGAQRTGPLELPPRALTPPRSARIYRLPDGVTPLLDVEPSRIGWGEVVFRFYDQPSALVAFVTHRVVRQRWAQTSMLDVAQFELHLATWVSDHRVLFLSTESPPALDDLLAEFEVANSIRNLRPMDLVRLVRAADPGSYFSVGLRAAQARRAQGATYDMTAGPAVEGALDYVDRTSTTLGHVMARPKSGNRGTVGFSVAKSKLWEPNAAESLYEYRQWALERAEELSRPTSGVGLPNLDVQLGEPVDSFDAEVVGASLDAALYTGAQVLMLGGAQVDPAEIDLIARREDEDTLELIVAVADAPVWSGVQTPWGNLTTIESDGVSVVIAATREIVEVSRALRDAPPTIYFADGAMVVGELMLSPREDVGPLDSHMLLSDEWAGVDLTRELGEVGTVQARTAELSAVAAEWAATDHGSYEVADFISLSLSGPEALIRLYHCKGSGAASPGRRLDDLYEVLSQAVKVIPWTVARGALWADLSRRLADRDAFKVIHGDEQELVARLEALAASGHRQVRFEMIAVQPGVSISDLANWPEGRALIHAASGWCSSEAVSFRLLGSE
jgi:superfamily II DNA or RNA helicase